MRYSDAIRYLKTRFTRVESGPRPGEISCFYHQGGAESTVVWPTDQVVEIAEISLAAVTRNELSSCGCGRNSCGRCEQQ